MVSFPTSLVGFLGFHPYMRLFSFRKLFGTCSCCFFVFFFFVIWFRTGKRGERTEGRPRGSGPCPEERIVSLEHQPTSKIFTERYCLILLHSQTCKLQQSLERSSAFDLVYQARPSLTHHPTCKQYWRLSIWNSMCVLSSQMALSSPPLFLNCILFCRHCWRAICACWSASKNLNNTLYLHNVIWGRQDQGGCIIHQ